jgi:toxin ParE1/3/4
MRILLTDRAVDDLRSIFSYLNALNPVAAQNQIAAIDEKFSHLLRFPFIGRERPSLGPGVRSVVSGAKVIFYLVADQQITVVRIVDCRMDLDEEFAR